MKVALAFAKNGSLSLRARYEYETEVFSVMITAADSGGNNSIQKAKELKKLLERIKSINCRKLNADSISMAQNISLATS